MQKLSQKLSSPGHFIYIHSANNSYFSCAFYLEAHWKMQAADKAKLILCSRESSCLCRWQGSYLALHPKDTLSLLSCGGLETVLPLKGINQVSLLLQGCSFLPPPLC